MKIGRVSLSGIFKFTHIWGHYLVISTELGYIPQNSQIFSQIELLRRKLLNFIKYLKNKQKMKREAYE